MNKPIVSIEHNEFLIDLIDQQKGTIYATEDMNIFSVVCSVDDLKALVAQLKWTPVSERLPSDIGIREGWFEITRADKDKTEPMYWKENSWGYFTKGIFAPVVNVVAWRPMPKPYMT